MTNLRIIPRLLFAILVLSVYSICSAQEAVRIKRINEPIHFDGKPDEVTWKALDLFELTMHKPNYMSQPSEKSDIRIGYDNKFLWVGASLFMNDPSKIFTVTKKRDEMLFDYDAFGIILDTYDDNENGLAFFTAPTGLRTDYTISNDAVGGPFMSSLNTSWDTFWDVKTTRDNNGWYVEMRIPFSSLKFKPINDVVRMGLIIVRNISAYNETDTYPAIDPKYGFMAIQKPSLAQTIEIYGARPEKPLYLSPYLLGGLEVNNRLNEEESDYIKEKENLFDAGLDVKYNINSNLTLDLTVNTDFAQVEADDQQVNLTRYSLFFPEKRKFFQERSSLFDFTLGGSSDNLFYSRRIGIANGNQTRIYGGARLTGRIGNWDVGFLDMQTEEYEEVPGQNFGVLRMRRQVINQNSYVGGILTSRIGMNGDRNIAYGVDGIFRLFGDDYLNIKWSQTYDNELGNKLNSLSPSFILLNWERRTEEGFAYRLNYSYSGLKFNPGIGFVRRRGVQGVDGELLYGWIPGEESKLFNYNVNIRGERYVRLQDGDLESMRISPGFEINTKKNIHGEISLEIQREGVLHDFNLSDSIVIKSGEYSFIGMEVNIGTSEARKLSIRGEINGGQFYDGYRVGLRAEPKFNVSSSLNLSLMYEFNAIRFPDRTVNNSLDIHVVNMKALLMLSTKLSASLLVQYVNTEDELITNFRLRYNPREGNDFYLVFNDFRGITNSSLIPEPPGFFNETVMVKYVHTFIL
ncbi:MAG TPA: DUF5916 domain-containing protein [Bacteroidales bacterium]|nr:carbohydrate binding family 9 domain-containing protein [Bacteroidales bacterium]HOU95554.1 DUF5916 domain-containing protein [Bacteroidales bacterium]HQG36175.1 DUF5916 domain-containing protein [Bacteroidales bacterium]HQG53493.1 DUF5916 domain-containing protein [Bacteroidales bacterium]HQJ20287.1 DUF5916 domain-containing protein [Bacteroidales bacterium]